MSGGQTLAVVVARNRRRDDETTDVSLHAALADVYQRIDDIRRVTGQFVCLVNLI
jgi:hypothetical protein